MTSETRKATDATASLPSTVIMEFICAPRNGRANRKTAVPHETVWSSRAADAATQQLHHTTACAALRVHIAGLSMKKTQAAISRTRYPHGVATERARKPRWNRLR